MIDKHVLPELPYNYDALEPYIDAKTMEVHHGKHHQAYLDKFNLALEKHPELFRKPVEELLVNLNGVPEDIRTAVKNNGGGYYNHSLFWKFLSPMRQECSGSIAQALIDKFGSIDKFKEEFSNAALNRFGSGWAWLVVKEGELVITSTANQDCPLSEGATPILCLDVWEHAYYLKYMNKRADYISAFWNVVNWNKVDELYGKAVIKD